MKSNISQEGKINLSITKEELLLLSGILKYYSDYISGNKRSNHGLNLLKLLKKSNQESKNKLYILSGKLERKWRKFIDKDKLNVLKC